MLTSTTIGAKLTAARKRLSLSQSELAERVSISAQAVGKWERGESLPDITMLNRLAELLGVDLNYFSDTFPSSISMQENDLVAEKSASIVQEDSTNHLPTWDMSQGNWSDADFSGLKNLQDKFSNSNMKNCLFVGSDLSHLQLKNNNIEGCDFSNSIISNSSIESSNIGKNRFTNCIFQQSLFAKNNIEGCDFSGVDFTQATFKLLNFLKNTLIDAQWNRTTFMGVQFDGVLFSGKLEACIFENCRFYDVTFTDAYLTNTFFKNNKNLKRIKFINCQVDRITYEFLKLGKADLSGISIIPEYTS